MQHRFEGDGSSLKVKVAGWCERMLLLGLGGHLIATLILATVPPVSRDALNHHLAIPKLYLLNGGMYEIPSMHFSYFPMNLDLLYMLPLYLNVDIVAKYIHFGFALLTAGLIHYYLKAQLGRIYALLGALLFLTVPVIVKLSVTVYVDLGLIFFSWGMLLFFLKWYDTQFRWSYLFLSAISCGLALGTKYNGLILLPIMGAMVPLVYAIGQNRRLAADNLRRRYQNALKGVCLGMGFILIAGILFSPWMIRNTIWKQNPVYPLYQQVFNSEPGGQADTTTSGNAFWTRRHIYKESFLQTLLIPIRAFFQGQDDNPKYFDGQLNPLLILFPLLLLLGARYGGLEHLRFHGAVLMIFAALFIFFVLFTTDFRIRYMAGAM